MPATYAMQDDSEWVVHQRNSIHIVLRPTPGNTKWAGQGFILINRSAFATGNHSWRLVTKGGGHGPYVIPCVGCREDITFHWPEQSSLMCDQCKTMPQARSVGPVSAPKNETTRKLKRQEQMKLF